MLHSSKSYIPFPYRPLLLAICQENAISPETVMRVWAKLNPAG